MNQVKSTFYVCSFHTCNFHIC